MFQHQPKTVHIVPVGFAEQQAGEAGFVELAAFEQNLHHRVVVAFGHVIRSLFVVRIGAALQQKPGQLGMLRNTGRAINRRLEQRARIWMVDHLDPAGVRTGSGIEQSPGRAHECLRARRIQPQIP